MATSAAVPRVVTGLVERPRLFELLDRGAAGPVTLVCAPAGSGKTTLLSSWLRSAELPGAVAWVSVERDETDATRFWGTVTDALRSTGAIAPGDPLATLAPAPLAGQEEFLQRLIEGLGRLSQTVLLIFDDLHQLRSDDALRDVELLLASAPTQLRTFIISRRDPKLGLHRMRVAGELVEVRAADLDFTAEEAGVLMAATGVAVAADDLDRLHRRTEGWAAGLRLAAMSLARHDAPSQFVAEFSGSERTVADYLLGEVLASQPPEVRLLLLRTCILERVTGTLADALTGRNDGARLLHELEEANALVVAVDVARSWFRYHHLLADLLRLELRREAPDEVEALHRCAAAWFADHGYPIEAIRHAQLGEDWQLAAELLGRHWVHLLLDGEEATLGALLAGLPADVLDGEIAAISAADCLARARWGEADALLQTAEESIGELPAPRRHRAETALATVALLRARRLGDLEGVVERAGAMLAGDDDRADAELQALALMNLGLAEGWARRLEDSEAHLEEGLALGRAAGRPYVEMGCLSGLGVVAQMTERLDRAEELLRGSIAVAERVGWSTHPMVGAAYMTLGALLLDRGRVAEGASWLERAAPILERSPEPAAIVGLRHAEGVLALSHGRVEEARVAFRAGGELTQRLRAPHFLSIIEEQWELRCLVALGDAQPARDALAAAGEAGGQLTMWCSLAARLAFADGDAEGACEAVAPVLAGTTFHIHPNQEIEALLLDGVARLALGDADAAQRSVERALAIAEPQGHVWIFITVPGAGELLERQPLHRTAHAAHLKLLLDHLAGVEPAAGEPPEPLSDRELAVLRFLPTNLSANEIGSELFLSVHTVKTHMRKLYAKLDVHTRAEAVQRGRALGLLAPARRGE
jgi:LuxR family maltose regulon positive regulatory protein